MSVPDWNPDPEIIARIQKEIKKLPESYCLDYLIPVGDGGVVSWNEVIGEIEIGTKFGREFYLSFVEEIEEDKKFKRR